MGGATSRGSRARRVRSEESTSSESQRRNVDVQSGYVVQIYQAERTVGM